MYKRISEVLNMIVKMLEKGDIPWRKEWMVNSEPHNPISKRCYSGINRIYLSMIRFTMGYPQNLWATFRQINQAGGKVLRNAKSYPVIFYSLIELEEKDPETEELKLRTIPVLKYYSVFNVADTTLANKFKTEPLNNGNRIERCEYFIQKISPDVEFGSYDPAYYPLRDLIRMPEFEYFESPEAYYSTLFHELAHWTGHPSRLKRDTLIAGSADEELYAKEELVAELTAAFICSHFGIENRQIQNAAAYLGSWLKVLKKDRRHIIYAASRAEKALNYLFQISGVNEEVA